LFLPARIARRRDLDYSHAHFSNLNGFERIAPSKSDAMPERALSSGRPREYDPIASEIRPGPSPEWR
jgi:hypothetical protein